MSSGQSFGYDALGRWVSRTAGGTTTDFVFDGTAILLEKQGGITSASYTYGNGLLTRSGEVHPFDGHGGLRVTASGTESITAAGSYEAYGQSVGGTGSSATPYAYGGDHGYRSDGDNVLLHIGARWYDPAIGRWISSDSYLGKIGDPLSCNRHAYCEGDPVSAVDPMGHSPWTTITRMGKKFAHLIGDIITGRRQIEAIMKRARSLKEPEPYGANLPRPSESSPPPRDLPIPTRDDLRGIGEDFIAMIIPPIFFDPFHPDGIPTC